jgi:hypothetical protein
VACCEKCWVDAYDPYGGQVDRYRELVRKHSCTPEEHAGAEAGWCPTCERRTVHQYARVCVVCQREPEKISGGITSEVRHGKSKSEN